MPSKINQIKCSFYHGKHRHFSIIIIEPPPCTFCVAEMIHLPPRHPPDSSPHWRWAWKRHTRLHPSGSQPQPEWAHPQKSFYFRKTVTLKNLFHVSSWRASKWSYYVHVGVLSWGTAKLTCISFKDSCISSTFFSLSRRRSLSSVSEIPNWDLRRQKKIF